MDHPLSTTYPDGGVTTYSYGNYALPLTITETHAPIGSTVSVLDDLGRLSSQTLATGAKQDKTYDALDNVLSISNWYYPGSPSPTDGYTSYTYDALNRPLLVCNPDNGTPAGQCAAGSSYKQTTYSANSVTSVDEAGNAWTHTTDAFGDLTQVTEPGSLTTLYTYDPLGRLSNVTQQGRFGDTARTRSFQYDSLSRLTSSTNPETGTIGYTYDANANLATKTDARGIVTSYSYDVLNRLKFKNYSDNTVPVQFGYDGNDPWGTPLSTGSIASNNAIGRLSIISNNWNAGTAYSYDTMGRVELQNDFLPDVNGWGTTVSAAYDLAGNMTDLTYPDGRHIKQTFDAAGRLSASNLVDINGVSTPASYLQSISYLPDGSPGLTTLGNGIQQTVTKNNRLQVQSMAVSSPLAPFENQTFLSHSYCYVNCATGGTANNGNIWGITDTRNAAKTQGFTYDTLNRISSFSLGGAVNQQFQIDSFGNMSPTVGGNPVSTFDPATNRVNNLPCASAVPSFDVAGNQLCSTDQYGMISQYTYDAESRITQIATLNTASPFVSYLYGADGARVRKTNADGTSTDYVDFAGQPIAEKDQNGSWTDYIYANGQKIAMEGPQSSIWLHGANGVPVEAEIDLSTAGPIGIAKGDSLSWHQYDQSSGGTSGGVNLTFENGWNLNGNCTGCQTPSPTGTDQNGARSDQWFSNFASEDRTVDLSAFAGHSVTAASLLKDINAPWGSFDLMFSYISITHANGTVDTIYDGVHQIGLSMPPEQGLVDNWAIYIGAVPGAGARYYLSDHLGSAQMEFTSGGWPLSVSQFAPYGGELDTGQSANHYKFTGKERDTESGLDYFGARYYASSMGRFMSPDWSAKEEPVPYAKIDNPQSLNLYSYVFNNPLSKVDADGHDGCGSGMDSNGFAGCAAFGNHPLDKNDAKVLGGVVALWGGALARGAWALGSTALGYLASNPQIVQHANEMLQDAASPPGSPSVWSMGWAARGAAIESQLGGNLPAAFPTIDRFVQGEATSIKSLDLNASSYQTGGKLLSTVEGYIDKVAAFQGGQRGGTVIQAGQITGRELQLAVPGAGTAAQQAALSSASAYAQKQGVKLTVTQVH